MSKPHILLINPNTSPAITESVRELAVEEAGADATIEAVTARFGARYISSMASFSIAGHAALDAYATVLATSRKPDAVIVGCFGDPGIEGLREVADVPVIGFAEAGMIAGAAEPGNFLVATVGPSWRDLLAGMARQRGLSDRLAGVLAIDAWIKDSAAAAAEISRVCTALNASRIVIGGTGLIPTLPKIARALKLPVIDPHRTAVREAISQALRRPQQASAPRPVSSQLLGLSPELEQLLTAPPAAACVSTP